VHVVNRLFNLLGYNPNGRQGPEVAGREEGYLFHLAWLAHQSVSLFSGQDGNGVFRPLVLFGACNTLANTVPAQLAALGPLYDANVCGGALGKKARAKIERKLKVKGVSAK
jgi:hypothetical protein